MPSLPPPFAKTALRGAIFGVLCTSLILSGCGSDDPTNRVDDSTVTPKPVVENTDLLLHSAVKVNNVKFRAQDIITGQVLGEQVLSSGHDVTFKVPNSYFKTQNLVRLELIPVDATSSYFDPITNTSAVFNRKMQALVNFGKGSSTEATRYKIDAYSDLAYQRTLARMGLFDPNPADSTLASLNLLDLFNALDAANAETESVFSTSVTNYAKTAVNISKRADYIGLVFKVDARSFADQLLQVGHILNYANKNPSDNSPWLGFASAARVDFLDGDLDGRTLAGLGDSGSDKTLVNSLIVDSSAPVNSDVTRNEILKIGDDQKTYRETYNGSLGTPIKNFFKNLIKQEKTNEDGTKSVSDELTALNSIDYATFSFSNVNNIGGAFGGRIFNLHSAGAGNYTRAFGLEANEVQKRGINVDDTGLGLALKPDLEALMGLYDAADGCRLTISTNGNVTLSKGTFSMTTQVNRELNDSITRPDANSSVYLINVSNPSVTLPTFVQIRTNGTQVLSATAGRSLEAVPTTFSPPDLNCSFTP